MPWANVSAHLWQYCGQCTRYTTHRHTHNTLRKAAEPPPPSPTSPVHTAVHGPARGPWTDSSTIHPSPAIIQLSFENHHHHHHPDPALACSGNREAQKVSSATWEFFSFTPESSTHTHPLRVPFSPPSHFQTPTPGLGPQTRVIFIHASGSGIRGARIPWYGRKFWAPR